MFNELNVEVIAWWNSWISNVVSGGKNTTFTFGCSKSGWLVHCLWVKGLETQDVYLPYIFLLLEKLQCHLFYGFTICWYPFFDCFLLSILLKLSPFFSWIMSLVYDADLAEYYVPEATDLLMAASFLLIIYIIALFRQKSLPKYTTLLPLWKQFKILILVSKEINAFLFFLDVSTNILG